MNKTGIEMIEARRPRLSPRIMVHPDRKSGRSLQASPSDKIATALIAISLFGCSSSTNTPSDAENCANPGGPVSGVPDGHCGNTALTVDPAICASAHNAVTTDDAGTGTTEYGDTLFNAEGDDDDCKYHVTWTSSAICENADVAFSMRLTAMADGSPVTGADPNLELFLNITHPGLVGNQKSQETSAGNYSIGPVQFNAKGQWTVRFHVFPTSCDQPTSQHGHAAFYVNVP